MTLTTTFQKLRKEDDCKSRYRHLRTALKGVKDNDPIDLLTILEVNGLEDALWALRATTQNCDRITRLIAADFAESVLHIWTAQYPDDNRPSLAIKAARDFANGLITAAELAAAGDAAWDVACAAWVARDAAGDAAWAAGDAAWAARTAAGDAAWAAAWNVAWAARAAAGAAAWTAAGGAAGGAEREKQISIFKLYLQPELHKEAK